jgi:hypothetical protein
MKRTLWLGTFVAAASLANVASAAVMSSAPADSWTVTNYYKQAVYGPDQTKIGAVMTFYSTKAAR